MRKNRFSAPILLIAYVVLVSCTSTINESASEIIAQPEIINLNPDESLTLPIQSLENSMVFSKIAPNFEDSLSSIFDENYQRLKTKGITCAACSPRKGFWERQYGFCDDNATIPVNSDTLMPLGSISKMFTAMIVVSLVHEGRLNFSDTVYKWFPEYDFLKNVTVDHLLRHTSGIITSELVLSNHIENNGYISDEDIVKNTLRAHPSLLFAPGTCYHYSNTGYIMLGIIAEKVSGKTMADLFNEKIILPLNLSSTTYSTVFNQPDFINTSFNAEGMPYTNAENPANPHAAGCIVSTPYETIKIFANILNGTIMQETDFSCLFADMNKISRSDVCDVYYGRGVSLIRIKVPGKEADYIGHKGSFSFFSSLLFYDQTNNAFCSIITNQATPSLDPLMFGLLEEF